MRRRRAGSNVPEMPAELREHPPVSRLMYAPDLEAWRRWWSVRREWRQVHDPENADGGWIDDVALLMRLRRRFWARSPDRARLQRGWELDDEAAL